MELVNNIHIIYISKILESIGERIEGNLICDINPFNFTISQNLVKIHNLQYLCKYKTKICEIGVNACHSLLLMLHVNPDAEYLLFDLGNHKYTEPCIKYIKQAFPNTQINIIYGNSVQSIYKYIDNNISELNTYDLCHIDGGHTPDIFINDFYNIKKLTKQYECVIFDDYDLYDIKQFINSKILNGEIVKYTDSNILYTDLHFIYKYL